MNIKGRDRTTIIDVREPEEFREGHIPGSILVPLEELGNSALLEELNWDEPIVVVCHTGNRSAQAEHFLRGLGYVNVNNFQGGLEAWQGPLSR